MSNKRRSTIKSKNINLVCPSFILCLAILVISVLQLPDSYYIVAADPTQVVILPQKVKLVRREETVHKKRPVSVLRNSFQPMFAFQRKRQQQTQVSPQQEQLIGKHNSNMKQDLLHRFKIASYFALWYALNIIYNSTYFFVIITMLRNPHLHISQN